MNITLTKNVSSGYAKLQTFVFGISAFPPISNEHITWILDDGAVVESGLGIKHIYDKAGTYNPVALVYYTDNNDTTITKVASSTILVKVDNYLTETIILSSAPPPTYAGFLNAKPFRVNVTSSNLNGHRIDLYAKNSRSDNYQEPQNKWSFSKPQWRFLDLSGNPINSIKTIDTTIYAQTTGAILKTSVSVGTSGYADFYFVDDIYNEDLVLTGNPFTTIVATLDTKNFEINNIPTFANSKVSLEIPHVFLYKTPDYLKITENGHNDFAKNKWSFAKHPFVISPAYFDDTNYVSSFVHYIPFESGSLPITLNILGVSSFNITQLPIFDWWSENDFELQIDENPESNWLDANGRKIGGFYKDYFTVDQISAENCQMTASLTFTIPALSSISSSTITITGSSKKFNIYSEPKYNVFKMNENFDLSDHMKSLAFMPVLKNSTFLFDDLLGGIFGKYPFEKNDLGLSLYEKTSNFVSNHKDIDKCDVFSLYDIAANVDLDTDDYLLNYPDSIRKIMDMASVNQSRLWGTVCGCGMNFTKINDCNPQKLCSYCGQERPSNRGNLLTTSAILTAGDPVVLKVRSLETYRFIPTTKINSLTSYPLATLADYINLPIDWTEYYEFYEFLNVPNTKYIESLIDWENPQTTLSPKMSSYNGWMGSNGIVENLLSFELFKGLELGNK